MEEKGIENEAENRASPGTGGKYRPNWSCSDQSKKTMIANGSAGLGSVDRPHRTASAAA